MLAMLALSATTLQADTVRVSFLEGPIAVRATSELVLANGCKPEAVLALKSAIARHALSPPGFDRAKFPAPAEGFYTFDSVSNLVEALPHRLCDSTHSYGLNCFDLVILLAKDLLQIRSQPDALIGPFLPAFTWTNGVVYRDVRATARDAFAVSCPSWYIDETKDVMRPIPDDVRVCLAAALYCWHALPNSSSKEDQSGSLLRALRSDWARQGLKFSTQFVVVLCHEMPPHGAEALTSHAGLLFHRHDRYSYLEKAGGSGPFVRLDFQDMADLKCWLAVEVNGGPNAMPDHAFFVTFNDEKIERLAIGQK